MGLFDYSHQKTVHAAGWRSRGYLPHFDGLAVPQFITFHLADSVPKQVIQRWKRELRSLEHEQERIVLRRRIEKYLDQGYGNSFLKDFHVANLVQNALLSFDGTRYRLFAWVVMPNHVHALLKRSEGFEFKRHSAFAEVLHCSRSE